VPPVSIPRTSGCEAVRLGAVAGLCDFFIGRG
jgi:hypothetical protein